jgi:hypothetical protein
VVAASCIVLASCGSNPFGDDKPRRGPQGRLQQPRLLELAAMDGNKDNQLSHVELEAGLKANFTKDDTNASGFLEASETRALNERLQGLQGMSPVIDWNADGKVDVTEYASQWRTMFDRADADGDGILDEQELAGKVRPKGKYKFEDPTFSGKDGRPPGTP